MAKYQIRNKKRFQKYEFILNELRAKYPDGILFDNFAKAMQSLDPKLEAKNFRRTKSWNIDKYGHNAKWDYEKKNWKR